MAVSTKLRITGTRHIYDLVDNFDAFADLDATNPSRWTFNRGEVAPAGVLTVTYTRGRGFTGYRGALRRFQQFVRQGEKV